MLRVVGEFLPVEDPVKLLSHRGQISSPVHINRQTAYNKQYKKYTLAFDKKNVYNIKDVELI